MKDNTEEPAFVKLTNLAADRFGAEALLCSDDFFAEKENLLKPGRGIFIEDKYTDRGKWMDGWESRRKRTEGHDWCIIKLGTPGIIEGVDIDTNHFLGNHPPFASIEACYIEPGSTDVGVMFNKVEWKEILPKSPLDPGSQHFFDINTPKVWTHLRLNIYPDGGVARLKVYGKVYKNWAETKEGELVDLAAAVNGGRAVICNDMFFSSKDNLIMPNRGVNMGDGWETKRNRTPNNRDWVVVQLAKVGKVRNIIVDTNHFKGNYPDSCSIEGCYLNEATGVDFANDETIEWKEILPKTKLNAHLEHFFENEIVNEGPFSHVRLNIFPDGGISRLRVFGI